MTIATLRTTSLAWAAVGALALAGCSTLGGTTPTTLPVADATAQLHDAAGADRGRVEPLERLAAAMGEAGVAFRAESVAGGPRQRLRFLPGPAVWELSTDADRDGRYESHRRFAQRRLAPVAIGQ